MPNLDFTSGNTLYATHGLHAYAAKCPPQLVRYGLRYYSSPGEIVLDPMAGSGTTLVEARLMGRIAIGYEIDPLARLIAKVKSTILNDRAIEQAYENVVRKCKRDLRQIRSSKVPTAVQLRATPPAFSNQEYWFSPDVSSALAILSFHISEVTISRKLREFLWVAFSSLILAKTSVANARDIIHSRHHFWQHEKPPDVMEKFAHRVRIMRKHMKDFRDRCSSVIGGSSTARLGDARRLRLKGDMVDLVFTSPPYVTALDYPRAHFLAVAWMQEALSVNLEQYLSKASSYIGTERGSMPRVFTVNDRLKHLEYAALVLSKLAEHSPRLAGRVQRYFSDMHDVLGEVTRLLKTNGHAVLVVCPSHLRKVDVHTHEVLTEIANIHGLALKHRHSRTISIKRRILPYLQESFGKRMDTEYVLVFQKR